MLSNLTKNAIRSNLFSRLHHGRVIGTMMSTTSNGGSSSESTTMPYDDDKMIFYALGINVAKQSGLDVILKKDEVGVFLKGFSDTLLGTGADPREVLGKYGMALNSEIQKRANKIKAGKRQENEKFISEFLKENKSAVKTKSGLVYLCEKEGTGNNPTVQDTVEIHYHGTLIDGRVFDSSVIRKKTTLFPLQGVIKGFQEGIPMMKEGGKATLVIPSDLAYGDEGNDAIPAASTLKFEVELFKVQPTSFK